MGFEPLVWFCRSVGNGIWTHKTHSAFGLYTPCAIELVVGNASHLVLLGLCLYRIWLIKIKPKVQRFFLRANRYNYILASLASFCAAEPLFRLVMGVSIFNYDAETGLAPFEVMHLDYLCITSIVFIKSNHTVLLLWFSWTSLFELHFFS